MAKTLIFCPSGKILQNLDPILQNILQPKFYATLSIFKHFDWLLNFSTNQNA